MLRKIVLKDLGRQKLINFSLFLFILLPALLTSNASTMILTLSKAMGNFFTRSEIPHFIQMHSGAYNEDYITQWNGSRTEIEEFQLVEMISLNGSEILLHEGLSEADGVMDIGIIQQNEKFDFLLGLDNKPLNVSPGKIAVPLYYKEKYNLQPGDRVQLKRDYKQYSFTIEDFVRDALMNPSIIHSKRFVVSPVDFENLKNVFSRKEFIFEYRLNNPEISETFAKEYSQSQMPSAGPAITYQLFTLSNAITEGLTITILLLVSLLFCVVAMLCLRFTLIASMEEDYREIGVMKGIGFPHTFISNIYFAKYVLLGSAAVICGYFLSLILNRRMTSAILLYMGEPPMSFPEKVIPLSGALFILLIVCFSTLAILRRFKRISAVEAIRAGRENGTPKGNRLLSLQSYSHVSLNVLLGIRDVILRFPLFALLGIVFFFCSFIILVPMNFLNTIDDPSFVSYMGIGKSDLRIDLRLEGNSQNRFEEMIRFLEEDEDVLKFSPLRTSLYKIKNDEGKLVDIAIESGDYNLFPISYIEGTYPDEANEIALSLLNAGEYDVSVGDSLQIRSGNKIINMTVCGIYQDITNGGYSAKAYGLPPSDNILWQVVSLDLKDDLNVSVNEKIQEYSEIFFPARVTELNFYMKQTLGETISQLRNITYLAIVTALVAVMLICSLFIRMILAKDSSHIAIMEGIGFSKEDLRKQYFLKIFLLLGLGVIGGTIAANTLGEKLISGIWSIFGASEIQFVINPLSSYFLMPLILTGLVLLVSARVMSSVKGRNIADLNAE